MKHNYIFTNRSHPVRGMMSSILGSVALASFLVAIYFTFQNDGVSLLRYGAVGLLATLFGLAGFVLGILSRMERDRYHLFSYLGLFLNTMVLALAGFILYLGI